MSKSERAIVRAEKKEHRREVRIIKAENREIRRTENAGNSIDFGEMMEAFQPMEITPLKTNRTSNGDPTDAIYALGDVAMQLIPTIFNGIGMMKGMR